MEVWKYGVSVVSLLCKMIEKLTTKPMTSKNPQFNILAVIKSKIKNMEYADKVDYFFFRPCGILFLVLLVLKITTIITVSWWVVFTPIIIPILVLWWELSKNAG